MWQLVLSASSIELERQVFLGEILFAWHDDAGYFIFLECSSELWELDLELSHFHIGHNRNQIDHEKATESSGITQNGTNIGIEKAKCKRHERNSNIHELEGILIHVVQGSTLFEKQIEENRSLEMIDKWV